MKGDDSNSSSGEDMDVDSSVSEDIKPTRTQRKASVGIKKSLKEVSESEEESALSDEDGSEVSSSEDSDSFADEDADDSDSGKKTKRVSKTTKRAVAKPKKDIKKPAKKVSTAKKKASAKSSGKSTPAKSTKSAKSTTSKRGKKDSDDEDDQDGSDDDQALFAQRVMRTVDRSPREQLVADLLCRWWYVLPDWPPADFDYNPRLAKENLRLVSLDKWEDEPDLDSHGRLKCYALSQYKGLYRDAKQQLRDLRPIEGKPSFTEFVKKSEKELVTLLVQAINKQIEILSNSSERNTEPLIAELKDKLKVYYTKRK